MKLLKYALIVLFSVGIMSCGGGGSDDDPVDEQKPTANITSPGLTVQAGSVFNLAFTANDDIGLRSYEVVIEKTADLSGSMVKGYETWRFDSKINLTDANDEPLPKITEGVDKATISFPLSTDFGNNTVAKKGVYTITLVITDTSDKDSEPVKKTFNIQ